MKGGTDAAMTEQRHKDASVDIAQSNTTIGHEASSSRIEEGDFITRNEEQDLVRGLQQRHISLIAIAGAIVGGLRLSREVILTRLQ